MKKENKKIKIIASHPLSDQDGIDCLGGREFEVRLEHEDFDGNKTGNITIYVEEEPFGGNIILNPKEYEFLG